MQAQESLTYQCINTTCGHLMPRLVKFCPYCGTPQQAGGARPVSTAPVIDVPVVAIPAAAATVAPPAPVQPEPVTVVPPVAVPPPVPPTAPVQRPVTAAAMPPQGAPLHWIWWLAGLGVLWLAWVAARPAAHKLDARIDAAIVLAQECKGKQAQSELIALRATRATPAQLQRLQTALNDAATACTRKQARGKAWTDASNAIDAALESSAPDKARARLATFTRRWGEDDDTRAARGRIDAARREPTAAPAPALSRESATNLMDEAERDIARGNYKGAIDKMDTCVGMVDASNRDCIALRSKAQRLYQGL